MLKTRTGIFVVHVPYRGTAEVLQGMMTNDIQSAFDTLPLLLPHIRAGKLRALAVSTPERVAHLPDVPTLKELSLSDTDVLTWYALIVPAGTPKPIVDRLHKEYTAVANMPEVQKFLADQGLVYVPNTQAQFANRIEEETKRWARLIVEKKIEVEQ
jgi:tripartite-type tricarboxylate transporter receptor subunit TctC